MPPFLKQKNRFSLYPVWKAVFVGLTPLRGGTQIKAVLFVGFPSPTT
jgi:hypothetical protein